MINTFAEDYRRILKRAHRVNASYPLQHPDKIDRDNDGKCKTRMKSWLYDHGLKADLCIIHTDAGKVEYLTTAGAGTAARKLQRLKRKLKEQVA